MKLVFVTPRFALEGVVGGAETLIRDLARTAAAAGHEVRLFTTCASDPHTWTNDRDPWEEEVEGMRVRGFRVRGDRDLDRFLSVQDRIVKERTLSREDEEAWAANSVTSPELIAALEEVETEVDAILAGPYLFGLTLQVTRRFADKTWLIPCLHDEPYARVGLIAEQFRAVRGCLFNAEPERELARRLYGPGADRGAVVGMAMEPFVADANAFAARQGLESPYVVYCGRREEGKNTELLFGYLESFVERRQGGVTLVLTGSGEVPVPERLEPYVIDRGFVSEREKHEILAGASAFIHPSVNESFGIVLLEAWLAGTPALVHDKGEVLKWQCRCSGGGLWFRYYPEFEAMLDLLLEDESLNRALAEKGRTYVRREYNREAIAERLFNALKEITHEN